MTRPNWHRPDRYFWQHTSGGKVCATPGLFTAWAAPEAPELSYSQWMQSSPDVQAQYKRGTPVAQRVRRLGDRATLAEACELVERWAAEQGA